MYSRLLSQLARFACLGTLLTPGLSAQNRIGTGTVQALFNEHCAICHGEDLRGGLGGSLLADPLDHVRDDGSMAAYIKVGDEEMGMPAFDETLSDPQIRSLVIYIREMRQKSAGTEAPALEPGDSVLEGGGYRFRMETVVDGLSIPWALDFLPSGDLLITERGGALRLFSGGVLSEPIAGTPEVMARAQGGLLDVGVHPDYAANGWIYLSYSQESREEIERHFAMTAVVRGRIEDGRWVDEEQLFEVPAELHLSSGAHYGSRFVFRDGYLFFSIGDRGHQNMAQVLDRPNGKIHRIHDDGRVPEDNPFIDRPDAWPTIWTYGNRNPQGLALHPETGEIWESEHGPRGGDEINRIGRGLNYGWPVITYGMNYSGTPITEKTSAPGMEQPEHYWTPSIAVCGIDFYGGGAFPEWKNDLFAGGLASEELHRLVIEDGRVVSDEVVLKGAGRIRDVRSGPDGTLYLVLNGPGRVVRLVPAE